MQGEKEMKGKVSSRHCAGTGGGDRHTDILSDQATRLLEFHMLYGTKNFARNIRSPFLCQNLPFP